MAIAFYKHKIISVAGAFAALVVVIAVMLPWQTLVERKLKGFLEVQGLRNVELTLSHIGLQSITLKEIKSGNNPPLILRDITLNYSLFDLLTGNVKELVVTGADVDARQEKNNWKISGLETIGTISNQASPASFPVVESELAQIPFETAQLKDSNVHIVGQQWQMDMPIEITWQKGIVHKLTGITKDFVFKLGALKAEVAHGTVGLTLNADKKQWEGQWNLAAVKMTGAATDVPEMKGNGKLFVQSDRALIEGILGNADHSYHLAFHANYFLNAPEKSGLIIDDVTMPWMGGSIGAQQVPISFGKRQPITVTLNLKHVSVQALLEKLTGKQAVASGFISGSLPVTIESNGSLVFHQGNLQADGPGTIALSPDAIPGDNAQVAFVREVLKNFHYASLSVSVNNAMDHKLSVLMALEGSNPDVLSGRLVKLNVNLTGDMLDFIQQNILLLSDPQKLIERGEHEIK